MTSSRQASTLGFASGVHRRATRTGDPAMTEHRVIESETITEDGAEHREALRKDYV